MNNAILPPFPAARIPTGPSVASVLEEVCRSLDMAPLVSEEVADLPLWTDEEADAFERTINEAFERLEEPSDLP